MLMRTSKIAIRNCLKYKKLRMHMYMYIENSIKQNTTKIQKLKVKLLQKKDSKLNRTVILQSSAVSKQKKKKNWFLLRRSSAAEISSFRDTDGNDDG